MRISKLVFGVYLSLIVAFGLASCNAQSSGGNFSNIESKEFQVKLNDPEVVIIDVRTPAEVSQGHINGADLFINYNGSDFEEKINSLDKNKTYYVYCRSGSRSASASNFMVDKGFKKVYNLIGGIDRKSVV